MNTALFNNAGANSESIGGGWGWGVACAHLGHPGPLQLGSVVIAQGLGPKVVLIRGGVWGKLPRMRRGPRPGPRFASGLWVPPTIRVLRRAGPSERLRTETQWAGAWSANTAQVHGPSVSLTEARASPVTARAEAVAVPQQHSHAPERGGVRGEPPLRTPVPPPSPVA